MCPCARKPRWCCISSRPITRCAQALRTGSSSTSWRWSGPDARCSSPRRCGSPSAALKPSGPRARSRWPLPRRPSRRRGSAWWAAPARCRRWSGAATWAMRRIWRACRACSLASPPERSCNHGAVILESSTHPGFRSNTYLVCDGEGGPAFFIDDGGPVRPLIEAAERLQLVPTHVLLTHHHFDHVCEVGELRARWPQLEVRISELERELWQGAPDAGGGAAGFATIEAGQALRLGTLEVRPLHTPGHTVGMLS